MSVFELVATLLVMAAVCSYLNYTLLRLPSAIGLMVLSMGGSLLLVAAGGMIPGLEDWVVGLVRQIDLKVALVHGILGLMLFAGALHIRLDELAAQKWSVLALSTVSVLISTVVVGLLTWGLLNAFGIPARLIYCLVFGALISPTDPVAVMAILRQVAVPRDLEIKIIGEALFNDGIAVVVFLGLLELTDGEAAFEPGKLAALFLWAAAGGVALGLALGWGVYRMLRAVDNYQVEILLSLALAAGGYALADTLLVSAPIAVVVAGLVIGNLGRTYAMSPVTRQHLDDFWELLDEILNSVLFVLIGLEVLALEFTGLYLLVGLGIVPVVLVGRFVSVAGPLVVMGRRSGFGPNTSRILTWGALRGGVSVALALSLPRMNDDQLVPERDVLVTATYVVVVFSILVQGLTLGPLVRRWLGRRDPPPTG